MKCANSIDNRRTLSLERASLYVNPHRVNPPINNRPLEGRLASQILNAGRRHSVFTSRTVQFIREQNRISAK
jgi:hypothetical protein